MRVKYLDNDSPEPRNRIEERRVVCDEVIKEAGMEMEGKLGVHMKSVVYRTRQEKARGW